MVRIVYFGIKISTGLINWANWQCTVETGKIVHGRLRPMRCARRLFLIFIVEQNSVGIDAAVSTYAVSTLRPTYTRHRAHYVSENVTSSTKPQVGYTTYRNAVRAGGPSHRHGQPAQFGCVISEMIMRADRQTGILITILRAPLQGGGNCRDI